MSLALLQNVTAMAPNGLTAPFIATGGTPPYVYSVAGGGAGGTINSSTGVYTSPSTTGLDTVRVTDAVSATASVSILIGNAIELLCDVIQTSMGLSHGQVYLWDQKLSKGIDSVLYVALSVLSCKPFGNTNAFTPTGFQIQSTNFLAMVSIDIFSRGPAARDQKELVLMCLNSAYAEQQMEMNSFRVRPISTSFVNLSEIDGAAIPYRYNIGVALEYFVMQTSAVGYFNNVPTPSILTNP